MFNENLKRIRKEKKLTQVQLAKMLECSQNEVSRWEAGKWYPSILTAVKIADVLGCTVDELVR